MTGGTRKTAEDLMAELRSNPEWRQRELERERQILDLRERLQLEEQPILQDLLRVGILADSIYELVNTDESYPEAIPVLLQHLRRQYDHRIREGIVRALTVREARGLAGPDFIDILIEEKIPYLRTVIANALVFVSTQQDLGRIEGLLSQDEFSDVRYFLQKAARAASKRK